MYMGDEDSRPAASGAMPGSTIEDLPRRVLKKAKLVHHPSSPDEGTVQIFEYRKTVITPATLDEEDVARRPARQRVEQETPSKPDAQEDLARGSRDRRPPARKWGFQLLPPEVRSMIYGHLFIKDYPIRPICRDDRYFEDRGTARDPGLGSAINLLRVSRLISSEASDVLYGRNNFLLYGLDFGDAVLAYLRTIGPVNCHAMRELSVDWQHGIVKINQASRAADIMAMISDGKNPLRTHLQKMLHDVGRATILKFTGALELLIGSPRLEHFTIVCPGNENPGHPDNHCTEYHDCPGCHHEVPKYLAKMKGLKTLTVGDTDWHNELEVLAIAMEAQVLNVTQVDCIEIPDETALDLEKQGWDVNISWRIPDGNHFRRVVTKKLRSPQGKLLRDESEPPQKQWW